MTATLNSSVIQFPTNRKSFDVQRFAWIESVILDHNMPHLARLVAARIGIQYLNPTSGDAWPSQATLAAELGVTIRAIQKSLDRLVGASHLHRKVPSTTLGRGHTNHYRPEYGALRANAGSPIGAQEGRTAEHGRANGCAKKGEPPFVQSFLRDPSKENHLKEEAANGFDDGRKEEMKTKTYRELQAESQQLAALTLAPSQNGSSNGTLVPSVPVRSDQQFDAELRGYGVSHGYKPDWAARRFENRYGHRPAEAWKHQPTAEPSAATLAWIKESQTAYAKAQATAIDWSKPSPPSETHEELDRKHQEWKSQWQRDQDREAHKARAKAIKAEEDRAKSPPPPDLINDPEVPF